MRARRSPGVIDSHEHHAAVTVRETHDGIHQVIVAQRRVAFGQKLGGELFTAREQAANVGVGEHDGQMRQEKTARIRGFACREADAPGWQATRSHHAVNPEPPLRP